MMIFQNAVTDTENLISKYDSVIKGPSQFNPEAIPARRRFMARRVKLLQNLLKWRKFTGEQHGIGLLIGQLVDGCVLNIAESGWDVGGEEVAKSVSPPISYHYAITDCLFRLWLRYLKNCGLFDCSRARGHDVYSVFLFYIQ